MKSDNLIGESEAFVSILEQVSYVAPLNKPVLIVGERGTGKELIAARIHYLSKRWDKPYLSLNCAALNENLLDSELFGHETGAFTGAAKRHQGRFERADSGTLFLDELATAPMLVQEKLLRVIEYGAYERVGGTQPLNADVRLVCATNEDLPTLARQGKFRFDLLDRLAFDVITLPPLRHRQEDIILLAEHFAVKICQELKRDFFAGFTPQAIRSMQAYAWPGNVRELKNVVERSIYRQTALDKPVKQLIFDPFASPWQPKAHQEHNSATENLVFPIDFKALSEKFEVDLISQAMKHAQYNQRQAAIVLGISYHQLRGLLKKYSMTQ
ncbi:MULTISPECIES: phage shock protein operon transcriptional activator [unclassified Motilimonas]|uniref:phage shock protein operon transcriptional activator n=1 Tax=Motilimonas TaxID=1914248 RepID=UPI001E334792|nr:MULTISPECIES: phage shock protein operon transcriptional activator [unclassified Motilimonas]MCE0557598.1 phage shock protein operon transcriptional activator [Motilimonas sp. E26]MDO6526275.1 phage shock protein operon transcriptional activator [Motilimonas sp. 1_MG-2023]